MFRRTKYEYDILPRGRFARYLLLEPGRRSDDLVCRLETSLLDEMPAYEAISYVWASTKRRAKVKCDGRRLHITWSLDQVLRRARLQEKVRVLWVDAICINQDNPDERGHQVTLMGPIYQKATRVLICIQRIDRTLFEKLHIAKPTETREAQHAVVVKTLVADVSKFIRQKARQINDPESSLPLSHVEGQYLADVRWNSLLLLTTQRWFYRAWVVQEAGLAAEAVILWGKEEIPWFDLVRTCFWAITKGKGSATLRRIWLNGLHLAVYKIKHPEEVAVFEPKRSNSALDFSSLLDRARSLDLTDNRDRIYAFLAFNQSKIVFQPRYDLDYLDAYADFAREYIRNTGELDLLDFIQHTEGTLSSTRISSWVPRWDMKAVSKAWHVSNSKIAGPPTSRRPVIRGTRDRSLEVRATIIDTVEEVHSLGPRPSLSKLTSIWKGISQKTTDPRFPLRSQLRYFTSTLCASQYEGERSVWTAHRAAFMNYLCWAREDFGSHPVCRRDPDFQLPFGRIEEFTASFWKRASGKTFVVTKLGYYGLAPSPACPGHLCAIIYGTRAPSILRKVEWPGQYQILGHVGVTSKQSTLHMGVEEHYTLGQPGGQDWLEWGLEGEDIVLI